MFRRTCPSWAEVAVSAPEFASPMQAKLIVIGGKANKKELSLNLPVIVGRSRGVGLTIAHPMVSRQHCEIFEADGAIRIRDLGSTNGTFVAGKKVPEAVLRPHDQFSIGPLTFEVDYEYLGDATVVEQYEDFTGGDGRATGFAPKGPAPVDAAADAGLASVTEGEPAEDAAFNFLVSSPDAPAESAPPPEVPAEPAAEAEPAVEEPGETATPESTATETPSPSPTVVEDETATPASEATATESPTESPTASSTPSPTPSPTPTSTPTLEPTAAPTPTTELVIVGTYVDLTVGEAKSQATAQGLVIQWQGPSPADSDVVTAQSPGPGSGVVAGSVILLAASPPAPPP